VPRFITPCSPVLRDAPPVGAGWIHEVKFDGWRLQVHKHGNVVRFYSRNGRDLTRRFAQLCDHAVYLPDCIIDGELVACDSDGKPDFKALMRKDPNLCIWCFDLLQLEGADLRSLPLLARKEKLREVLITADDDRLRYSEEFTDPVKLLATVDKMGLEGVVSKRADAPYRSGTQKDWVKVKARTWREAKATWLRLRIS
jgi:bifunctional non-homologous end joining protein LigD